MSARRLPRLVLVALPLLAALSPRPVAAAAGTDGGARTQVVGGAAVAACAWPSAVELDRPDNKLCSGTLIAPQVVVYAAHCGSDILRINFGENALAPMRTVVPSRCVTFPNYSQKGGTDYAYCLLPEPIRDIPIVPVLIGCEAAALRPGRPITLVGFGADDAGVTGIKRATATTVRALDAAGILLGGDGRDTCNGDSGGPAFVQLDASDGLVGATDGSWRAFGITSFGPPDTCGTGGHDSLIAGAIPWIERTSGLDVTPCTDATGAWSPGPDCGSFPLSPDATGSWDSACVSGALSGPSATCGTPFAAVPPQISIVSPAQGDHIGAAPIEVTVRAVAGSSPLASVALTLDGTAVPVAHSAGDQTAFGPVSFTPGSHMLVAAATDTARVVTVDRAAVDVGSDGSVAVAGDIAYGRTAAAGCAAAPDAAPWALVSVIAAAVRRRRRRSDPAGGPSQPC